MPPAPPAPIRVTSATRQRIYSPLHRLRGTIRRYIVWETMTLGIVLLAGVFWFGLAFDYGSFKIAGIDWVQYIPRFLRAFVLLAAGGLFSLLMFFAFRRVARRFGPRALALVLERRFPKLLRDRLITAVELTDLDKAEKYGYSRSMIVETVRRVSEDVEKLPVGSVFNWRRLYFRWFFAAMLTFGVLTFVMMAYLGWNLTLNVGNFAWRFTDVTSIWFERNVLMRNVQWPRRAYLVLVDFPESGDLRIGQDAPSPRVRVQALKWVMADRDAPDGWRGMTLGDLTPELLGDKPTPTISDNSIAAFDRKRAIRVAERSPAGATAGGWMIDHVEQVLQDPLQRQELAALISADQLLELDSAFEELEQRAVEPRYSRTLRKLEIPREVKIYYWGLKSRDEAPLARQQQGVNEYAVVLTDLKESVKFHVKGEDYETHPYRRITLVPPPKIVLLEKDELLPAYPYHRPPADGTALDLKGLRQQRLAQGVSLMGGTSRIEIAVGADLVLRGEVDKDLEEARVRYRSAAKSTEPGRVEPLPLGDNQRSFRMAFARVSAPIEFDFEFTDTDHVKSLRHVVIQPVDDKTPDVNVAVEVIRKTAGGYMCTPYANIPFSGTIRDDIGLARVEYAIAYTRVESAQVAGLRATIATGFLGLMPTSSSPRELFGSAGLLDYLNRLAESREAAVTLPALPLKSFDELVADKARDHAYGKEKLPELLATQQANLEEWRRERQIAQYDVKPNLETLDLRERVPDLQRGLEDTIRPRYRMRVIVQAVDNNVETGPRTGQNRETFTFNVVPYEELLAEMNKDEEVLAYKSQELSDKMIDIRNAIDKMIERMPRDEGSDEFRASASRMDEVLAELEKGSDLTRELLSDCARLLKEAQANRLPANFVDNKEKITNLLDEAIRSHFERAREAHTVLRDALQSRRVPEPGVLDASRQRQEELNRQLDQVRDLLGTVIGITKLASRLSVLIEGQLVFKELTRIALEDRKDELNMALAELAPSAPAVELQRGEKRVVTIDLGRDTFAEGRLRVALTAPADSGLTVASPVNVARLVKSANVEITAGDKPGTFDVPMTITDPKGVVLRLKDDKPLILKVTVK